MPVFHIRGDSNRLPPVQRARMSVEGLPRKELANGASPWTTKLWQGDSFGACGWF